MNEYENIIKQVVSATFCNRLTEEEACEILCSLYRIASNSTATISVSPPPYQPYYTDTFKPFDKPFDPKCQTIKCN